MPMKLVKVKRDDLLAKVRANRDQHAAEYDKAVVNFKTRVEEEIKSMLKSARNGDIRLFVGLTAPQDHTKDYDKAISMLEMCQDEIIELDQQTFGELVLNQWPWFEQASHLNSTYASGGKIGNSY